MVSAAGSRNEDQRADQPLLVLTVLRFLKLVEKPAVQGHVPVARGDAEHRTRDVRRHGTAILEPLPRQVAGLTRQVPVAAGPGNRDHQRRAQQPHVVRFALPPQPAQLVRTGAVGLLQEALVIRAQLVRNQVVVDRERDSDAPLHYLPDGIVVEGLGEFEGVGNRQFATAGQGLRVADQIGALGGIEPLRDITGDQRGQQSAPILGAVVARAVFVGFHPSRTTLRVQRPIHFGLGQERASAVGPAVAVPDADRHIPGLVRVGF